MFKSLRSDNQLTTPVFNYTTLCKAVTAFKRPCHYLVCYGMPFFALIAGEYAKYMCFTHSNFQIFLVIRTMQMLSLINAHIFAMCPLSKGLTKFLAANVTKNLRKIDSNHLVGRVLKKFQYRDYV